MGLKEQTQNKKVFPRSLKKVSFNWLLKIKWIKIGGLINRKWICKYKISRVIGDIALTK